MTCKDCLHYDVCSDFWDTFALGSIDNEFSCVMFSDKSEWVHLQCKKGDVLERKGDRCEVYHWNVLATAFTEDNKLRLFGVEEAEKALEERREK